MDILITNDDGIYAEGIRALAQSLKGLGRITVVAPEAERSAVGHAITLSDPIHIKRVYRGGSFFGYSTSGTPADCVKLAIKSIMKRRPDIVASGINLGPNVGYSVLYSGTVSGATEGAILGIPSFAISLATFTNPDYRVAAAFARRLVRRIVANDGLPRGTLLNVNVPAVGRAKIKGVRVTRQGERVIDERFDKREDPRKRVYFWLTGENIRSDVSDSDTETIRRNYISVTPIHSDMTDHDLRPVLETWKL